MNFVEAVRELWAALRSQVTRGKHVLSAYDAGGQRTMLQGIGFAGETHQGIELLLPYGMSAIPIGATADYVTFEIGATRDHKVAFGCDDPALRVPGLLPGEIGHRNYRGSQVVLRQNRIEMTAPLDDIDVTAAEGAINITASAGKVTITAGAGQVDIIANGNTMSVGGGTLAISTPGNVTLAAAGTSR